MNSPLPEVIETDRLILRPYHEEDSSLYYQISQRNRDHLAAFEAGNAIFRIHTEADALTVIREFIAACEQRSAFFLGAFLRETGEWVAQVYIGTANPDLPEYELGYIVDTGHEGRGYVSEAARAALDFIFVHLGARRVRLECDDTNPRSSLVAERIGLKLEGHLRQNHLRSDGSVTGTLLYGMLREEWHS
jgi:[ribosomal protein S5]-alanine N-acetyltransferase